MPLTGTIFTVLLLAAILALLTILRRVTASRYPAGELPYFSRGYLLSKGEAAFFQVLRRSLPNGLFIAPKVRVSDLIGCNSAAWKQGFGGRISQKHVDFVLVDEVTTAFVVVIELDDQTLQVAGGRQGIRITKPIGEAGGAAQDYDSHGWRWTRHVEFVRQRPEPSSFPVLPSLSFP
jgi:hypothetical protein